MEAKRLCVYRFTLATTICLLIQYLLLTFLVFITNVTPLSPFKWIFGTFRNMISLSTFLSFIPIGALTVFNGVMLLQNELSSRKVGELYKLLRKIIKFGIQLLTGLVSTFIFLSYLTPEYGSVLTKSREYNLKCIYLLLCGIATVSYFTSKRQTDSIEFPVISQTKYVRIKSAIQDVLMKSLMDSIFPSVLCALAVTTFMGVGIWSKSMENDKIFGLIIDYRLYFYTWLLFAHISCILASLKSVFEIVFTEYQQFPIEKRSLALNDTSLTLADGLLYTKIPIIQTLAALDLFVLSKDFNVARRKELFSLSSIGGHPHNFRKVNEATMVVIQDFIKALNDIVNEKKKVPLKENNTINNNQMQHSNVQNIVNNEKVQQRDFNDSMGIRNLMASPIAQSPNMTFTSPLRKSPSPPILSPSLNCNVPSSLKSIFGEDKSKKVNTILRNYSDKITLVSQAVASIATASLTEDKYGVLQDYLPKIISTMLELHQILEKINTMNLVQAKKSNRHYITARQATKRSLHKIVKEFHPFFNDMVLDIVTLDGLKDLDSKSLRKTLNTCSANSFTGKSTKALTFL
uniref:CSON000823 protein n=1 Tax=Culicoides sonorensis TaxID=179676 RepID=A0A336KX35_CULSO